MKGKKSQKSFDVDAWFNARMKELAGSDFELPVIDDFELPKIDDFEFPWLIDIPDEVALAAIGVTGRGDADKSRASSQKNAHARVMGCAGGGARELKPRCGAKTRTGKPCQAPGNGRGGRCKLHGGKSTGPKTQEGKARSLAALRGNHPPKGVPVCRLISEFGPFMEQVRDEKTKSQRQRTNLPLISRKMNTSQRHANTNGPKCADAIWGHDTKVLITHAKAERSGNSCREQ